MEMASRPFGLMFGRFIFEFGIPGSAGSVHGSREPPFPRLERYYRSQVSGTTTWAVLPLMDRGTTAVCPISSYSCQFLISFAVFGGLCSFFLVVSSARVFGYR